MSIGASVVVDVVDAVVKAVVVVVVVASVVAADVVDVFTFNSQVPALEIEFEFSTTRKNFQGPLSLYLSLRH